MRQIVLDTETTGLDPKRGHRVIEIGCLELLNRQLTGRQFHVYLNPEREIDPDAVKIHGLTSDFLSDKPFFRDVFDEFLAFIDGAELIIHNAPFDVGFILSELGHVKAAFDFKQRCDVVDTLVLAKQKHPGQKNNLDALCKRYGVNNTNRQLHGALLDAELLAYVYLAMTGGQLDMFGTQESNNKPSSVDKPAAPTSPRQQTNVIYATEVELSAHQAFMERFKQ